MSSTDEYDSSIVNVTDVDVPAGLQVGEYVVAEKIGEGGFGSVYRAEHPLIGKQVAIKVLSHQYSAVPEMVSRFVAEARAVNQVKNRYIIDIFSFGQLEDGRHYYIMELLRGMSLDDYLANAGPLSLTDAIPILRGVAKALDAAHQHGIAHRDLKPENVFLQLEEGAQPFPKLLDFGIAKLLSDDKQLAHKTRTGAPIGTPAYMSPEQCRGKDVDHRTDIYSFGVLVFELLTLKKPFDGESFMDVLFMHLNEEPPAPSSVLSSVPKGVDDVVRWAMQKRADDRPPSVISVVEALESVADSVGIKVPTAPISAVHAAMRSNTPGPASDTLGLAATVTPSGLAIAVPPKRGRKVILALAATGALAGAVAFVATRGMATDKHESPANVAAVVTQAPNPQPVAVPEPNIVAPPADAGPSTPDTVSLHVVGAPAGAEVTAPTGRLGRAADELQLPYGEEEVVLTLTAKGYNSKMVTIVPNRSIEINVSLEKKRRSGTASRNKNRNSLENPF